MLSLSSLEEWREPSAERKLGSSSPILPGIVVNALIWRAEDDPCRRSRTGRVSV